MKQTHPDYDRAIQFALQRLEQELDPKNTYHNFFHTQGDVLPAVRRLARETGVEKENLKLLEIGAAYHDIGFLKQRQGHEIAGATMVAEILPQFGFRPDQIQIVQGLIMATQLPQSPKTCLEELVADADLDVLGRDDFFPRNQCLRDELAAYHVRFTDQGWLENQINFLETHTFFTSAARKLRRPGKKHNLALAKQRLAALIENPV